MSRTRTVRLVNVATSDRLQLELMLPLLDGASGHVWEPTLTPGADLALVDLDRADGDRALIDARENDRHVAVLTATPQAAGDLWCLQRPLRAADLTARLQQIAGVPATAAPDAWRDQPADAMGYCLVRWPDTDTMRADPDLLRICGALVRRPRSVDSVSRGLGLDRQATADHLARLEELGSVERARLPPGETGASGAAVPASGLVQRLRNRLGWN